MADWVRLKMEGLDPRAKKLKESRFEQLGMRQRDPLSSKTHEDLLFLLPVYSHISGATPTPRYG